MFDIIRKKQYFKWIEEYASFRGEEFAEIENNLKDIQDHYIIDRLHALSGLRILEIGGADCRVLRNLAQDNECWNAEKFQGLGQGPRKRIETLGVQILDTYIGEFSPELQDGYFDLVFSISVVEHVEDALIPSFFHDIARVLKPGGRTVHAIDLYVCDASRWHEPFAQYSRRRLALYLDVPNITQGKLSFIEPPKIGINPGFSCEYASNADRQMRAWNLVVPRLASIRDVSQSVSLIAEWVRC